MIKIAKRDWPILAAVLFSIVCLALLIGLIFKIWFYFGNRDDLVKKDLYQAVFLNNNQIYFGKLKNINSRFLLLQDVYYVQLSGTDAESGTPKGRIVKLGEIETHGPMDEMVINRDHVIFWENMRSNSQVVQTIQGLKSQSR